MRRYGRWICLVMVMMLLGSQAAFAGRGPGVPGETATEGDTGVRYYPGWNGYGTVSPMISSWVEDEDLGEDDIYAQGWRYSPSGWWYQYSDGGWPVNGWKYIDSRWYYVDQNGHLVTGWLTVDGETYYLNPADDGTYGQMRTGWQIVDGKAYYFNAMGGKPLGAMLRNTTTPDGYQVGADGAMIVE